MAASDSCTTVCKVCWGVFSLISRLHLLSILIKKLARNVAQIILYYHVTKHFFLAWIDWSHACDMKICFGKTLVVIDFDEKVTETVAQIIKYHMSKYFLSQHFAVGQGLSVSAYDLENGKMACKEKCWIKNMVVKIPVLVLFRVCLLCWLRPVSVVAASCFNHIGPCRWF